MKIAKISHHAKAVAFAKLSLWVKNLNSIKYAKNNSTSTLKFSLQKKNPKKTPNIRKMTTFPKVGNLFQKLWPLENRHFGSKIKILKNMPTTTLQAH